MTLRTCPLPNKVGMRGVNLQKEIEQPPLEMLL